MNIGVFISNIIIFKKGVFYLYKFVEFLQFFGVIMDWIF